MKAGFSPLKGFSFGFRHCTLSVLFKPRVLNLLLLDTHEALLPAKDSQDSATAV